MSNLPYYAPPDANVRLESEQTPDPDDAAVLTERQRISDPVSHERLTALADLLDALTDKTTDGTQRARILDSAGAAYGDTNRLPVDIGANIGTISAEFRSVVSDLNIPPAPLAAGESWTGQWEDVRDYASIVAVILTDQAGTAYAEFTENPDNGQIYTLSAAVPANIAARFVFGASARYFRVRYVNGPVAQTLVRGEIRYTFSPPPIAQMAMGASTTDLFLGGLTQSHLKARIFSGASAGAWVPLGTDGTGALMTTDATLRARIGDTAAPAAGSVNARLESIRALIEAEDYATQATLTEVRDRLDTLLARTGELTLTGRMLEKRPATGYRLWLHDNAVTNLGTGTILAEAPAGSLTSGAFWRGILVPGAGGQITERTAFTWDGRLQGWVVE